MDKTLQAVAWSSYLHAYGSAKDIPETIASLESVDPEIREIALDHLAVTIYHQGDIYPATAPAVAALIQLAVNEQTPDRPGILGLVEAIAESATRLPSQVATEKNWPIVGGFAFSPDYSLGAKTAAERDFSEVCLPVQTVFASQRAAIENLCGDRDSDIAAMVERILGLIQELPYSNICDPVYRCLAGTEYGTMTAFALANPTLTFGQLAARLGKRISALHVWWALLTEAQASANVEALARRTLVREIREHTRERGWGVSIHFHRMYARLESSWFSRFADYREQCEAVWALLVQWAEKGWLPQSPDDSIIRACFDEGWRTHWKRSLATHIAIQKWRARRFLKRMIQK